MIKSVQYIVLVIAAAWLMGKALQRLQLSLAKSPSLGGHLRWAKRIAGWIQGYAYDPKKWFHIDGADEQIQQMRRHALARLGEDLRVRSEVTLRYSNEAKPMLPDLQFISNYRVPFQFREVLQQHIALGSFWKSSDGVWLTDPDGNRYIDVTGSYGVNVFGQDFYKDCIAQGGELVQDLGPVLGSYHPCVLDNLERLQKISGKEQFTFHMSGTEAVMQAVRVARYTTGKKKIVRFTSAYHGWWDDVQPGPGNPMPPSRHTLTLREMHANTLRVLRNRKDIACVLVNPIQAMHPNRVAPTDSTLVTGGRRTNYDRQAYTSWLKELRQVCTEKGILLIMDEIFLGFRLAPRGAQQFFDVKADLITYG
ncbi:MAG TPA: glutamate-1-semialdehyde 2,1-aminomutase, partial [Alcaligenaceae bacterium]|nr:glutamate-1-semialdehyde 2,1-aminomutase [Alcaligenaceae bacterium]